MASWPDDYLGFEIWNQICRYDYHELKLGAIEESALLIISLERLLFLNRRIDHGASLNQIQL